MRVKPAIVALLASLGVAWATTAPASALESGVFADPSSPAGKEYSFPLDTARGEAVGRAAPQGATEPLFGVGIARAGASRVHSSTRASRTGRSGGVALAGIAGPHSAGSQEALLAAPILIGGLGLGVAVAAVRRRHGRP